MKLYLAGIKSYHLDLGIDHTAFSDLRLERTIHGIKRDHHEPERRIRTPLIRPHLLLILQHPSTINYNDIVTRAAFTLAFAGFLRVGEFTYTETDRQPEHLFPKWFLTKNSIGVPARGEYMEVTLPSSKTDPFRKGIKLTMAASHDNACPVRAMQAFFACDRHRPQHAPLFCVGHTQQQAFSRQYVVNRLQGLAFTAGLNQGTWNGHSFRRGAATWAAEVGIPEAQIQTLGRWKSYAYKTYIEYSNADRISLPKCFQTSQTATN